MNEMLIGQIVIAVVLVGTGGLLWWMAKAAASGKLKRNQVAGIRTATTLSSDEAWLVAHRHAERPTMWAAVASALSGFLVFAAPTPEALMAIIIVGSIAMVGLVGYGAKLGIDAVKRLDSDAPHA